MYGIMNNGCCTIYSSHVFGSKPIINSEPEKREGYYPVFKYIDKGEYITQEWMYREGEQESTEDLAQAARILLGVNE